ncbi:response regulator [Polyangium spumosum]|uniref:Response regulator n=1 Tax=Polyangium spumosum TaxID=889282 RepID=A0A6N7PLJ5_9BACT|nr:response regulator [Polyangium spumosum]MRG91014.1 response regulator [Polyangium spumosum]
MCQVLVVDDNEDIRETMRDFLEEEGYHVVTAKNGADALSRLEQLEAGKLPCLMLVDLLMPVMDGVELIRRLRESARFAPVPVIAISAASTVDPPPGTRLLPKPVGPTVILEEVRNACGAP